MKDFTISELYPRYDSRRSFYGKALVIDIGNAVYLRSYDTIVCGIDCREDAPHLLRFWDGWSVTTARHVREFCRQRGLPAPTRSEWYDMPIQNLRERW